MQVLNEEAFFTFPAFERGRASRDLGEKKRGRKKKGNFLSAVSPPAARLERSRSHETHEQVTGYYTKSSKTNKRSQSSPLKGRARSALLRSANVFIEGGKAVFNHCQVNVSSGLVAAWRRVNAASSLYNKRPPRCTTSDLTQPKGWLQG